MPRFPTISAPLVLLRLVVPLGGIVTLLGCASVPPPAGATVRLEDPVEVVDHGQEAPAVRFVAEPLTLELAGERAFTHVLDDDGHRLGRLETSGEVFRLALDGEAAEVFALDAPWLEDVQVVGRTDDGVWMGNGWDADREEPAIWVLDEAEGAAERLTEHPALLRSVSVQGRFVGHAWVGQEQVMLQGRVGGPLQWSAELRSDMSISSGADVGVDGSVVGHVLDPDGSAAFLWRPSGGLQWLDGLGGGESRALAMAEGGWIAGWATDALDCPQPVLWDRGTAWSFGILAQPAALDAGMAKDVNRHGVVVGQDRAHGRSDVRPRAWIYQAGVKRALDDVLMDPGLTVVDALRVLDDGSVLALAQREGDAPERVWLRPVQMVP